MKRIRILMIVVVSVIILMIIANNVLAYSIAKSYSLVKIDDNMYITNVEPNTTIKKFTTKLNKGSVKITRHKKDITDKTDYFICTGDKVKFNKKEYTVLVYGDINGDGIYSYRDYFLLSKYVSGEGDVEGNFITYPDLTDDEILKLTNLCKQENGTPRGIAAEASLMANLFEKEGQGCSSVYDYVRNHGWFKKAGYFMDNGPNNATVNDRDIEIVKNVLLEGKRTVPGYIDEHDGVSDLTSVTNNGSSINKSRYSEYVPFLTVCKNNNDSTWIYYCHPDPGNSDPFGYKSEDRREEIGEFHYEFDPDTDEWTPVEI